MNLIEKQIKKQGWVLADGATGTNYFLRGLETGHPPELWCEEKPSEVIRLHKLFLDAGCDIILTNSFGCNSSRLKLHNCEKRVNELNLLAAKLAIQAINEYWDETGEKKAVAGSMGPTGELFSPLGTLTANEAVQIYSEQAESLAEGGVDLIWIETISSLEEVDAAISAAKATGLPIIATMTFDTAGKSMMGISPSGYASHMSKNGVYAFGANCGLGPAEMIDSIMGMKGPSNLHIVAKGNCGIPQFHKGSIEYPVTPHAMGLYAKFARDSGATIIGGCCGTTPKHIAVMKKALACSAKNETLNQKELDKTFGKAWPNMKLNRNNKARHNRRSKIKFKTIER